jgi:hypothetical protein
MRLEFVKTKEGFDTLLTLYHVDSGCLLLFIMKLWKKESASLSVFSENICCLALHGHSSYIAGITLG